MTFTELCASYNVTDEERSQLLEYWGFMKFKALLQWLDNMKS